MLEAAIRKTYLAIDKPAPEDIGMKAKISLFLEDLEEIPTQAMDKVFRVARQRKPGFFPTTGDLMLAWKDVKAEHEHQKEIQETRKSARALPEYYPESLATDSSAYIRDPTPEKLAELRRKYPTAGF